MKEQLKAISEKAANALKNVTAQSELEELRVAFLGKKGELTGILKQMGKLSAEERPAMGQLANTVRSDIEAKIAEKSAAIKKIEQAKKLEKETIDVTLPGKKSEKGGLHPLNTVLKDMINIFQSMGFDVVDGPEVETEYYNFEALNVPADHPARDMQDTFYVGDGLILRSQTSATQIRTMENRKPPIRMICPGEFTVRTMLTPLILPSSTKLRDLSSTRALQCATLKAHLNNSRRKYTVPTPRSNSAPPSSPSPSPASRSTFPARNAEERAAASARVPAGLKFSEPAWFTRECSSAAESTRRNFGLCLRYRS